MPLVSVGPVAAGRAITSCVVRNVRNAKRESCSPFAVMGGMGVAGEQGGVLERRWLEGKDA